MIYKPVEELVESPNSAEDWRVCCTLHHLLIVDTLATPGPWVCSLFHNIPGLAEVVLVVVHKRYMAVAAVAGMVARSAVRKLSIQCMGYTTVLVFFW